MRRVMSKRDGFDRRVDRRFGEFAGRALYR